MKTCKYCEVVFHDIDVKVFANHVRWCTKNTTNGDKGALKFSQNNKERFDRDLGPITEFTVSCKRCKKDLTVRERSKRHPERIEYFCSRSCANSRGPRSEDFKEKLKSKLAIPRVTKACNFCGNDFYIPQSQFEKSRSCSRECAIKFRYRDSDKTSLQYYRRLCAFKFAIKDFPQEFDCSLIEKYGWYAPKNRGDNLGGVSRDHIVSIRFGFDNKIEPEIISHPANCRLVIHNDNVSKGTSCGMSLSELLEKIKMWDKKYNSCPPEFVL